MSWPFAFAITELIEVSIGWIIWRENSISKKRKFAILFGASLLTHPVVWFVLPFFMFETYSYEKYLIVAESFAFIAEATYYYCLHVQRPILLSLVANMCSFLTGIWYHGCIG